MIPSLGFGEIAIIAGVVVILFGAKRIPEVARSLGKSIREFKGGLMENGDDDKKQAPKKPQEKIDTPPNGK